VQDDNRPRPYSRLNPATGRIEWVTPEEHAAGKPKRSRLESDDEVRARIRAAVPPWDLPSDTLRGKQLDRELKRYNLPERRWFDED
jgi:hypothetical protein